MVLRHDSSINFIQPSGGNILETHHAEFESLTPTPSLPSGGVWFDPNDIALRAGETRTERLKYQTVSGVREVRVDEGYTAQHRTALLNMGSPPEEYNATFDAIMDDKFYDQSGTDFTIQVSGLYRVSYTIDIQNDSGGGNNDGVNQIRVLRNGVDIPQSASRYFQDGSTTNAGTSKSFLVALDVDDILTFEFSIIGGGGNSYVWAGVADNLNIEFIRRWSARDDEAGPDAA